MHASGVSRCDPVGRATQEQARRPSSAGGGSNGVYQATESCMTATIGGVGPISDAVAERGDELVDVEGGEGAGLERARGR